MVFSAFCCTKCNIIIVGAHLNPTIEMHRTHSVTSKKKIAEKIKTNKTKLFSCCNIIIVVSKVANKACHQKETDVKMKTELFQF